MEFNIEFVAIVVVPIVLGLAYLLVREAAKFFQQNPDHRFNVPAVIEPYLHEAIMWAANMVEQLDKSGELSAWIDTYADKGEAKLNLAVDYAVEYIETRINTFVSQFGIPHIDIPEALIKDMIQRYVWENPSLFPSSKVTKVVVMQSEQKLTVPTDKHARLQPANYPANTYKVEENVETTLG